MSVVRALQFTASTVHKSQIRDNIPDDQCAFNYARRLCKVAQKLAPPTVYIVLVRATMQLY